MSVAGSISGVGIGTICESVEYALDVVSLDRGKESFVRILVV